MYVCMYVCRPGDRGKVVVVIVQCKYDLAVKKYYLLTALVVIVQCKYGLAVKKYYLLPTDCTGCLLSDE